MVLIYMYDIYIYVDMYTYRERERERDRERERERERKKNLELFQVRGRLARTRFQQDVKKESTRCPAGLTNVVQDTAQIAPISLSSILEVT